MVHRTQCLCKIQTEHSSQIIYNEQDKIVALRDLLAEAQGRSEFVIVVVADVRGFSTFSKKHESTDIAMFIKRFYMRMIDDYFSNANFYNTRGDGLLMTFPYSEKDLPQVANDVISNCMQCLVEFSRIGDGDPMINFKTPENIGFGIARGTACCLYSNDQVIDYSGHLLNLCSRLMNLARPNGIVIDGHFLRDMIPEEFKAAFVEKEIYIRGISEERSYKVSSLDEYVHISEEYLTPLKGSQWYTIDKEFRMYEIGRLGSLRIPLPSHIRPGTEIKVTMSYPKMSKRRTVKGYRAHRIFKDFEYNCDTDEPKVILELHEAYKFLKGLGVLKSKPIHFKIQFIPDRAIV